MKNRIELLDYINTRKCDMAVEVGCFSGKFSLEILQRTNVKTLYCVDAFDYRNMSEKHKDEDAYEEFYERVSPYIIKGQVVVFKKVSPAAASHFQNFSFDFIYLDAGHAYFDIQQDLVAWFPKLKIGGIMAGHDYKNLGKRKQVKKAVDEFFDHDMYEVQKTNEPVPSFWVQT